MRRGCRGTPQGAAAAPDSPAAALWCAVPCKGRCSARGVNGHVRAVTAARTRRTKGGAELRMAGEAEAAGSRTGRTAPCPLRPARTCPFALGWQQAGLGLTLGAPSLLSMGSARAAIASSCTGRYLHSPFLFAAAQRAGSRASHTFCVEGCCACPRSRVRQRGSLGPSACVLRALLCLCSCACCLCACVRVACTTARTRFRASYRADIAESRRLQLRSHARRPAVDLVLHSRAALGRPPPTATSGRFERAVRPSRHCGPARRCRA
jgi:hypothetical protein